MRVWSIFTALARAVREAITILSLVRNYREESEMLGIE